MKILITSGGTTEKIDAVRGITNHSTGYLGKEIAELFLAKGHQVTLVTTKTAVKPEPKENLKITEITNVDSLLKKMEPLVKEHDVHSPPWLVRRILSQSSHLATLYFSKTYHYSSLVLFSYPDSFVQLLFYD